MADGKKIYEIVINGVKESVDAVESLNKQLDALEKKIDSLSSKAVNVSAGSNGTGRKTSASALSEEEKLTRKILDLDKKREAYQKEIYKSYLAAKDLLKETLDDQKQLAAAERLAANQYTNTMLGMKQQLADIKAVMQTVDLSDTDQFNKLTKKANSITNDLKKIEESYGQYGRNVGNYANGVAEGLEKIRVAVGDSTREYDNYRQAVKDLTQERFKLSQTVGRESEEYKKVDAALEKLKSDYKDLDTSSSIMDNLLDTMESFTALASAGAGLSSLFGLEDSGFEETMKKLASLLVVLKSFETLNLQWKKEEGLMGWLKKGFKEIDSIGADTGTKWAENFKKSAVSILESFYKQLYNFQGNEKSANKLYEAIAKRSRFPFEAGLSDAEFNKLKAEEATQKELLMNMAKTTEGGKEFAKSLYSVQRAVITFYNSLGKIQTAMKGIQAFVKWAAMAFSGIVTGGIMLFLPELLDFIGNFIKSLNTTKIAAERAAQGMKTLNRQLEIRRDIISSQYLKGQISDEQFLKEMYDGQSESLVKQIDLLRLRSKALQENASGWGRITNAFDATQNTEFTGRRLTGDTTVGHGRFSTWFSNDNDIEITVKNIKELENAWNKCNEAVQNNQDYFSRWGNGIKDWYYSITTTVKDTEEVMRGLGNVRLSDFVARIGEVNEKFNKGQINAEQYAKELQKLKNEMNDNSILNSVIANLDKYIPDEGVRQAVNNILNELIRLDDAFNMTSPQQIHYWNQVRIDGMKDGFAKEKAQIAENERYEIQQYGKTQEQINLIHAKYNRQRLNAQERVNKESINKAKEYGKKLRDAENELISLRIENMKEGLEKQLAQIENERRLALQKARESGVKTGDITLEINKKYDKKILDEKRKWAFNIIKIYEDLEARIEQTNRTTFQMESDTAERNVSMREQGNIRNTGYQMITPTNYDNTKDLEEYYRKVYEIQKKALNTQSQIQQETLDRELDFNKKEEEIRHKRIVDENNGEFIQQLRAGVITREQYNELIERENDAHNARMNALDKKYASETKKVTEDNLQDVQELYSEYFDKIINGISRDKQKIDEIATQPLITDDFWGIVNIKKMRETYKSALDNYENLKQEVIKKQTELDEALKNKEIKAEDFAIKKSALDDEMKAINQSVVQIKQASKQLFGEFWQGIDQYMQILGQAATQIIQSIGQINDAAFEKQMEALEKQTEALEEQLNKQKELTQKYADDVEGIEDELSTARGDRRQHLIDQLNAQMQAQRESLAQEKAIEKEQERLEKKKEKMEEENNKRRKAQATTTALINAALAISNAAVNHWPMPALAMIAAATAVGAAQVAAVRAAKYADGGVLVGKSHRQGGIKLLNGYAEAEGGEYITNKRTTSRNVDLLDYINSKKRRIDLSDMIEFYSDKPRKTIKSISKRYFEDGGYVPTLRTDIDINDRLINTIEAYNDRPVVVSVVDVINRADNVRRVQTLAGLE